ncbi:TPA: hypothetical protein ACHWJ6_000807 [Streptococcus suis]
MSDFNILGMEEILDTLERKLGEERTRTVVSKALRNIATNYVAPELEATSQTFRRTGETVRQIVRGNVRFDDYGIPKIKVGWGKGSRWRLEHLQEMGFTSGGKFHTSHPGFGKLQALIDECGEMYPKLAKEELKELVE